MWSGHALARRIALRQVADLQLTSLLSWDGRHCAGDIPVNMEPRTDGLQEYSEPPFVHIVAGKDTTNADKITAL